MTREFVVIDDGFETELIDPVLSVDETATAWFVDNGFHQYEVPKIPGRTVIERCSHPFCEGAHDHA